MDNLLKEVEQTFTKKELLTIFEAAHVAATNMDVSDFFEDTLDISCSELSKLWQKIDAFMTS